jgi:hypothetical protein
MKGKEVGGQVINLEWSKKSSKYTPSAEEKKQVSNKDQ